MTIMPFVALVTAVVQDTAGKVAYVARPEGPPDTSGYMWAGYAITAVVYAGYIALLLRRMSRVRRGGSGRS